jgi:phage/plasmid-associated DNA primase
VKVKREDYITQTTGYKYDASSATAKRQIKDLMEVIFADEEDRLCYISILRTCMIGIPLEKFILANGAGGNGKGLINELLQKMLGPEYFYKASITTIVDKMKDGPNPAVANMHKKRCVLTAEPRDDDRLNLGTIKQLTGGNDIN